MSVYVYKCVREHISSLYGTFFLLRLNKEIEDVKYLLYSSQLFLIKKKKNMYYNECINLSLAAKTAVRSEIIQHFPTNQNRDFNSTVL